MGSHFVVLSSPFFDLFARVVQIQKPIPAQTFEPNGRVEAFEISIVGRLSGSAKIERDAVGVSPQIKFFRGELAALIDADRDR